MLVLTSYYGEVRQDLGGGKASRSSCWHALLLSDSALGKNIMRWLYCMSVSMYTQQSQFHLRIPWGTLCVCTCEGHVWDREKSVCSRQSDLTADRLWWRDGGATSAAQLTGNPWHGVSYWANTEVSSCRESTSWLEFTSGQNLLQYKDDRLFYDFCMFFYV